MTPKQCKYISPQCPKGQEEGYRFGFYHGQVAACDDYLGTPCEQTLHTQEIERLQSAMITSREVLIDVATHLIAAVSLLEKCGKDAKRAAPSDKMFDQMITDYKASIIRANTHLTIDA